MATAVWAYSDSFQSGTNEPQMDFRATFGATDERPRTPGMTQYMVIEKFLPGCKEAVYERFAESGRMLPKGLVYLDSWLEKDGVRCFQLMETHHYNLFSQWIERWKDLTEFEVIEIGPMPIGP